MNPRISVVIAVYNGVPYLEQSIRGALEQEVSPHEVIVIDDGSIDDTPEIIKRFGGRVLTRRIPNGGVANAMNIGIALATGDFVAFLDHDDVWFRHKLRLQTEVLSRYPDAGFVCCNYAVRHQGLGRRMVRHYSQFRYLKEPDFQKPYLRDAVKALIIENFVGTSSAVLVRKSILDKVGKFNTGYQISGDYDYWLRCALEAPLIAVPEVLFYKRTHATNISANGIQMLLEHKAILKDVYCRRREWVLEHRLEHRLRLETAKIDYRLGVLYAKTGEKGKAASFFMNGLCSYPHAKNAGALLKTLASGLSSGVTGAYNPELPMVLKESPRA